MRRAGGRDETYFLQLQHIGKLLRQAQMTEVYGIESAAENADEFQLIAF